MCSEECLWLLLNVELTCSPVPGMVSDGRGFLSSCLSIKAIAFTSLFFSLWRMKRGKKRTYESIPFMVVVLKP